MNTFTKKALYAALFGAAAVAGTAQAVNVSADGLGQVLIYPYYTVNNDINGNAWNTLLSIVNTTGSTKAVKVRFREGRESVEVLDFNVFLTPFDVWTASLTPTSAGGAHINTSDKTCTIPTFPSGGQDFLSGAYAAEKDNAITRTAEGYFEVFEMVTYTDAGVVGTNAKHSGGVPKDCTKVTDATAAVAAEQGAPSGGLFGNVILVNPAGGGSFSQPATALDNFCVVAGGCAPTYFATTSASPTYTNVAPPISNVIAGNTLYQSVWAVNQNAVTAVLMANSVTNEYVLDAGSQSQTNWVVTQPTKFLYVSSAAAAAPYTAKYVDGTGSCEVGFAVLFDREESTPRVLTNFSPITSNPLTICWESTVLQFVNGSNPAKPNIFGSRNTTPAPLDTQGFPSGWARFDFNDPNAAAVHTMGPAAVTQATNLVTGIVTAPAVVYYGLPAIGFAGETFNNNALVVGGKTYLSQFGATLPHHYAKKIQ